MGTPVERTDERQLGSLAENLASLTPRRQPVTPVRNKTGRERVAGLLRSFGNAVIRFGDRVEKGDSKAFWEAVGRGLSNRAGRLATWARGFTEKRAQKGERQLSKLTARIRSVTAKGLRGTGNLFLRASAGFDSAGKKLHQQADRRHVPVSRAARLDIPADSASFTEEVTQQADRQHVPSVSSVPRLDIPADSASFTEEVMAAWERAAKDAREAAPEPNAQTPDEPQVVSASRPASVISSASSNSQDFSAAAAASVAWANQYARHDSSSTRSSTLTQTASRKGRSR